MKATILTSLFAVLLSVMSLSAQNDKDVLTNSISNGTTVEKEHIEMNSETGEPYKRNFYIYDNNGKMLSKTVDSWNSKTGWVSVAKSEFGYNESGNVDYIVYTKWNESKSRWEKNSQYIAYVYDESGKYLSMEKKVVKNTDILLTQR